MRDVTKWVPKSFFSSSLDKFFDEFVPRIFESPTDFDVVVDIQEDNKNLLVKAELPGLKKDDISVEMNDSILTISGEKKFEKTNEDSKYHRSEITYGKFIRSFHVPIKVKPEEIKASFKNGVLQIKIPKAEIEKTKRVSID